MAKIINKYMIAACFCGSSALIVLIICFSTEYWVTGEYIMVNDLSVELNEVNHGLFTGTIKKGLLSTNWYPIVMTCLFAEGYCAWSCKGTADERYYEVRELHGAWYPDEIPNVSCTSQEPNKMGRDIEFRYGVNTGLFPAPLVWGSTILFLGIAVLFNAIALGFTVWKTIGYPKGIWAGTVGLYIYYGIAACSTLLAIGMWGLEFGAYSSHNLALTQTIAYSTLLMGSRLDYSYYLLILAFTEYSVAIAVLYRRKLDIIKAKQQNFLRQQATMSGAQAFMS